MPRGGTGNHRFFSFRDWISFFSIHAENILNHQRLGKETSVAPVQSFPRKTLANQLLWTRSFANLSRPSPMMSFAVFKRCGGSLCCVQSSSAWLSYKKRLKTQVWKGGPFQCRVVFIWCDAVADVKWNHLGEKTLPNCWLCEVKGQIRIFNHDTFDLMVLLCCIGIATRTVAGLVGAANLQMMRCFLRLDGLEDYGVAGSPFYMRPFSCARKCLRHEFLWISLPSRGSQSSGHNRSQVPFSML